MKQSGDCGLRLHSLAVSQGFDFAEDVARLSGNGCVLASGMFCVSGAGMWAPRVGRKAGFRVDFIQKKLVTEGCLQSEVGWGFCAT